MQVREKTKKIMQDNCIGKILINSQKITEFDIEKIINLQKEKKLYFGETAIELGLVSKEDVDQALAYQFTYPYLSKNQNIVSREIAAAYTPFTPQVEAIKNIRTTLMLSGAGQNLKSICLVSCKAGAGKTFVGANLAVIFAQFGHKTLLMDFNLRNPRIHKLFKLKNSCGVSTLLINRSTLEEAVHTTVFEKLNVLPSGPMPPNPLGLVSSKEVRQLMETLKSSYEIIIVNTSSFEKGRDASFLASLMDGVFIVALEGKTHRDELCKVKMELERNGTRLLGVVLNQR